MKEQIKKNPFTWVEIYVDNMTRARNFYETVFTIELVPMETPGEFGDLEMMSFPWAEGEGNISGALCKTADMKPSRGGTLIYFTSEDCDVETSRVEAAGGKVLQEKQPLGEHGYCSICEDSEGNTIGLHSNK